MARAMLETQVGLDVFDDFISGWASERLYSNDPPRIAKQARALAQLEHRLDENGSRTVTLIQDDILDILGPLAATGARRLLDHLITAGELTWEVEAEAAWREKRAVRNLVIKAGEQGCGEFISGYLRLLKDPQRPKSLRTIRMYISTAVAFLYHAGISQPDEVTEDQLRSFLHKRRGQYANLSPLRAYVVSVTGRPLSLPGKVRKRSQRIRDLELVTRTSRMRRRLETSDNIGERRALVATLISSLFGVAIKNVLHLAPNDLETKEGSTVANVSGEPLTLPAWLAFNVYSITSENSVWVFPGRGGKRPITPASVWYHVRGDGSGPGHKDTSG
jgi:hypothetical protein